MPRSAAARRPGSGQRAAVEFGLDRLDLVVLRPELQGAPPLITGLDRSPALPVGVPEMVVDRRILRHQLDRLFQILNRARIVAEAVMRPAEAVDDVTVFGPQF